jgi:hypothetical protein
MRYLKRYLARELYATVRDAAPEALGLPPPTAA